MLAVILAFPVPAQALSAKSAIVLDCVTGRVLFEKDADQEHLVASTTKIMTALIVCEQCNVLDRIKIPEEAVGIEGSSMYLQEGEILTVQDLLYGLMLHSGNDAAVALAIYCGGTVEGFVERMNDKARVLGLLNTHFENPHGLDSEDHHSTARDLGVLAAYAMENPIFEKTVSTKTVCIGERTLRNHNKLLWRIDGADGVKTGYTKAAGRILVSSVTRNDRRLVAVTIAAPDDWNDHLYLLERSFGYYENKRILEADAVLGFLEIAGGQTSSVQLICREDFFYSLSADEKVEIHLPEPGFVYAPVAVGQAAGFAQLYLNGKWIGKVPLVYGQTVEQEPPQDDGFWERLFRKQNHERAYTEDSLSQGCCIQTAGRNDDFRRPCDM